ncbi:MAG: hypothetical protein IIY17_00500 [Aeriscardovia sp.]|nr:hypothetical protein [Aeriscardovia sp.]
MAKKLGVKGVSTMRKPALVGVLAQALAKAPGAAQDPAPGPGEEESHTPHPDRRIAEEEERSSAFRAVMESLPSKIL